MKILVVSNTPWNTENSFGNSYSNIFDGIDNLEFANVFCRYGSVNSPLVKRSFKITEKSLIKNLKNKKHPSGEEVEINCDYQVGATEAKAFEIARKKRFRIYALLRELIWKIGRWKSPELEHFVKDFSPDIIFQPVYYSGYINDIALYCKELSGVKMLGYISDDCYTLRQLHFSPIYWIERLWKRKKVKKTIENCEILYVISEKQKEEYEKIFTPPCKVLTKCSDFSDATLSTKNIDDTVNMVYAGNISKGRATSLSYIASAVNRLNAEGIKVNFDIYSATPIDDKLKKCFSQTGCSFRGKAPYDEVKRVEREADILVHIEGLSLKDKLEVRLSFSTKLVDFFEMGKCIFAVGLPEQAFAKHLIDNDAGVVASDKEEVYSKLKELVENKALIGHYGNNAFECGRKHHNKATIQEMIKLDLNKFAKEG